MSEEDSSDDDDSAAQANVATNMVALAGVAGLALAF